jgi:hypothetical protein
MHYFGRCCRPRQLQWRSEYLFKAIIPPLLVGEDTNKGENIIFQTVKTLA